MFCVSQLNILKRSSKKAKMTNSNQCTNTEIHSTFLFHLLDYTIKNRAFRFETIRKARLDL